MTIENRSTLADSRCARCGTTFGCDAAGGACWCAELPVLPTPDPARGCYCRPCLEQLTHDNPASSNEGVAPPEPSPSR